MQKSESYRILVTGGSSFVGKHLIKELLGLNEVNLIIACSRQHRNLEEFLGSEGKHKKLVYVNFDLLQASHFESIIKAHRPDYCVHLAAMARLGDGEHTPALAVQSNIRASIALHQLSEKYHVKGLLFASSNLAREAISVVGMCKYLMEAYAKHCEASLTPTPTPFYSYRLPNIIDSPGSVTLLFKRLIHEGQDLTITDARMSRKFIDAETNALQMIFMLKYGMNGDIFVNNMAALKITDLAEEMILKSGKKIEIRYIGMKAGEKLEEKDYDLSDVIPSPLDDIFVLQERKLDPKKLNRVFAVLEERCKEDMDTTNYLNHLKNRFLGEANENTEKTIL